MLDFLQATALRTIDHFLLFLATFLNFGTLFFVNYFLRDRSRYLTNGSLIIGGLSLLHSLLALQHLHGPLERPRTSLRFPQTRSRSDNLWTGCLHRRLLSLLLLPIQRNPDRLNRRFKINTALNVHSLIEISLSKSSKSARNTILRTFRILALAPRGPLRQIPRRLTLIDPGLLDAVPGRADTLRVQITFWKSALLFLVQIR